MGESIKRLIGNIRGPKGIDGKAFDLYNLGMYDEYAELGNGMAKITRKTAVYYISPDCAISVSDGINPSSGYKYSDYPYFVIGDGDLHFNIKHFLNDDSIATCNTLPYLRDLKKNIPLLYLLPTDRQNTIVLRVPECMVKNADGDYDLTTEGRREACARLRTWLTNHPTYIYGKLQNSYQYIEYVAVEQPLSMLSQAAGEWLNREWRKGLNIFNPTEHLTENAEPENAYRIKNNRGAETVFANIPVVKGKKYTISMRGKLASVADPGATNWLVLGVQNGKDVPYWVDGKRNEGASATDEYGNIAVCTGVVADGILSEVARKTFVAESDWISLSSLCTTIEHLMLVEGAILYPCEAYHGGVVREKEFNELKDRIAALEAKLAAATETEG